MVGIEKNDEKHCHCNGCGAKNDADTDMFHIRIKQEDSTGSTSIFLCPSCMDILHKIIHAIVEN